MSEFKKKYFMIKNLTYECFIYIIFDVEALAIRKTS
jgi:hypothetical protein